MNNRDSLDEFETAYLTCALWSTTDESDPNGGEPMDANYGIEDIAPDSLAKMLDDCRRFQAENAADLESPESSGLSQAGHDFWLTRNGHGCGFWEYPDWPRDMGKRLTESARRFGSAWLYVGDDGQIHC